MKKTLWILIWVLALQLAYAQAYKHGEFLKYRIHYFFFNAGYATLQLKEEQVGGKKMYHAVGLGKSASLSSLVMKINDRYETWFDEQGRPHRFIRDIEEGNYKKDVEFLFHHEQNLLQVIDKLNNNVRQFKVPSDVQDMLSVYYALRNVNTSGLKKGDFIEQKIFFDYELYPFKMKILGREYIKTKFGYIRALILRPYVPAERVFKEEESLTVWVSDDENKIPLRIEAKLLVGSIKADLTEFRGLKFPIHFSKRKPE
jgi:hypothetical protein